MLRLTRPKRARYKCCTSGFTGSALSTAPIVLLWLEGLPYDEIGAITGISAKNVSVRLVRIREELKQMTDEE